MILKSHRVRTRQGVKRLLRHLVHGDENEGVEFVHGTEVDVADMHADAKANESKFCVRHWIVSPHEAMTRDQLNDLIAMMAEEFGFAPERTVIVEHKKPRAVRDAFDTHWHVLVGEVDPVSGRVLRSSFDHVLHELIARWAEHEFGHGFVLGRHTKAVVAGLRKRGMTDLGAMLAATIRDVDALPREGFSHAQHQEAKRSGIDLPRLRAMVKDSWAVSDTREAFAESLEAEGLRVCSGRKPGTWVVETEDGDLVGAVHRLVGARKSNVRDRMEETTHGSRSNAERNAPGSPATAPESRAAVSDIGAGRQDQSRLADRHADSDTEANPERTRRPPGRDRKLAQAAGRHRWQPSSALLTLALGLAERRSLVEETLAAANILALPPIDRIYARLATIEEDAIRLQNQEPPLKTVSSAVQSARAAVATSSSALSASEAQRRAVEGHLFNLPKPRWWWKFTGQRGRHDEVVSNLTDELHRRDAAVRAHQQAALGAKFALVRAERRDAKEYARAISQQKEAAREAGSRLNIVAMARQILRTNPDAAHSGFENLLSHAGSIADQNDRSVAIEIDSQQGAKNSATSPYRKK